MLKERKYWDNQIISPDQLEVGMIVAKAHKTYTNIFKITKLGLDDKLQGELYLRHIDKDGYEGYDFYSDSNLAPYESGWNETNYIRWATPEEVIEFEKTRQRDWGRAVKPLPPIMLGKAGKAYRYAMMYGTERPKHEWDKLNIPWKEKEVDICCENCAIETCPAGCLEPLLKGQPRIGKHNYQYNNFKPKKEETMPKYEIVEGKEFKLSDLVGKASDKQFWNFCKWLDDRGISPDWNLLTRSVVDYAADKEDSCFLDFLLEKELIRKVEDIKETYEVGQVFKSYGGEYFRIHTIEHNKYQLLNITGRSFWGKVVIDSTSGYPTFTDEDFPTIEEHSLKKVNMEYREIK